MRLTLPSPVRPDRHLDVEVDPGTPAGVLRRRLALLTGDPRWAAPAGLLEVAGRVLDDHHPTGAPPLLPGAHLAPGAAPHADAEAAVLTRLHLAVLAGPGTGRLVALPDGARVRVPLPPVDRDGRPGAPARADVRRRGEHVRVRVVGARGTMPVRHGIRSRRTGSPRRRRTVGRRWRTWPPQADLEVRGTALQLRGAPDPRAVVDSVRRHPPAWAWTAVVSAAGALLLAVVLRQPLLLLTAATGLVGLAGLRGERAAREHRADLPDAAPSPCDRVPRDVAALRLATALRLRDHASPVPGDDAVWPPDRTLALVGGRAEALGAARALVLRSMGAATPTRLVVRSAHGADWRWTRWWDPTDRLPTGDETDVLVVADDDGDALGAWRLAAPRARLLLVVPPAAAMPAWARTVLRAAGDGAAATALADAPSAGGGASAEVVDVDVADAQARGSAALAWSLATHGTALTAAHLPPGTLGDLPGVPGPDAAAVSAAWRRPARRRSLAAPLGTGPGGGAVVLDLVRDGPHCLVAGTTGAGKSELLTTLVLGLALTHPPHRLAVLLVDFKGGTGLGPLAALPHVVDHVHDLDVVAARRTLQSLRAEVRRRERLLAAEGCVDVADLDPADPRTPARLLVVVDELRALVEDLPDATAALARLAAQGRALGVHLLLATQRPAGAVSADLRANVGLRIALRVADDEDSRDVLGCVDAAHLDVAAPGRALVRVGARPATPLQVARARHRRPEPSVRLVAAVPGTGTATWRAAGVATDDVAAWVAACRQAARATPGTAVPWVPALPLRVTADDVEDGRPACPDELLVAVADVPDEQRRVPVRWGPGHGPLLVLGGPRSGRSSTLLTVGAHALAAGAHVHAIGLPDTALRVLRATGEPCLGTTTPLDDPHRAVLLLDRLVTHREAHAPPVVLLVDGLDVLLDACATHARGAGVELLTTLVRHPPPGVRLAAAGPVVPALSRLLGAFGLRLVLPVPDPTLDALAGVPSALSAPRASPGRAVACTSEGALLCQVVLPARGGGPARPSGGSPVRIGVLPERSTLPAAGVTGRAPADGTGTGTRTGTVPLGVGGDGPGPVEVDAGRPLVVAGPPGAGRTTTLHLLVHSWASTGHQVLLVTVGPRRAAVPRGVLVVSPGDALSVLQGLADGRPGPARRDGSVVLLDDVDLLERTTPALADLVERLLAAPADAVRVVALATTTEHATTAYRGPVATALRARQLLVLDAHGAAAADLLGPAAGLHADPRSRPPGRGVLRRDRLLVRVQVHDAPVPGWADAGRSGVR